MDVKNTIDWRGKIGGMAPDEVTSFLNGGVLARLATLDANGYPYIVPIWFEWEPEEGIFWIIAREKSKWATMIRDNPRVALSIDEDVSPLRKVFIQGRAELVEEYTERFTNPYIAAERGMVDDVIDPADTRRLVSSTLAAAATGGPRPPRRFVDTW